MAKKQIKAALNRNPDVVIAGGGPVGCALALAVQQIKPRLAVTIVEANPAVEQVTDSFDQRVLALSYGSKQYLQSLGVWQQLAAQATPIHDIHVSDRGHIGQARLSHREYSINALGYVVPLQAIGQVLLEKIAQHDNIQLIQPDAIRQITAEQQQLTLGLSGEMELSCLLLVAADGGTSSTRKLLHIENQTDDYQQSAIIANVRIDRSHNHCAYERFTSCGPIALLPMSGNMMSLVWTLTPEQATQVNQLPTAEFLDQLQQAFGYRVGKFIDASPRFLFPLALIAATEQIRHRAMVLGNASHTLHPIAGQGFNLGLRDIACLQKVIKESTMPLGSHSMLSEYLALREADQTRIIRLTDGLTRIFSNDFSPMVVGRNLGLMAMQLSKSLKDRLAYRAMGLEQ